jgi:predicted RNA methylase
MYMAPPRLRDELLFSASTFDGEIVGRSLVDLGCRCGVIAITAAVMGAASVHAFDIDLSAIEVTSRNLGKLD